MRPEDPSEASSARRIVVSLEIPGIVVSLDIPVFRIFFVKNRFFIVKKIFKKIDFSSPEKTRKKSGKARENYRKNPCIFLAMYEKYLTERVLPSFRVCYKNDLKNGISGFGIEFPSDAKICIG